MDTNLPKNQSFQVVGTAKTFKNDKNKKFFAVGSIVLIFAVIGLLSVVTGVIYSLKTLTDDKDKYSDYNKLLIPVVAVDPTTFDDINDADMGDLINISIQALIKDTNSPDKYTYTDGYMLIPQTDVDNSFKNYFGEGISIIHQNVEGYGFTFNYDKTNKQYKIPLTAVTPIYTPELIKVKNSSNTVELTVGMVNAEKWEQKENGSIVAPEADKYIKITLLEQNDNLFINTIQVYNKA